MPEITSNVISEGLPEKIDKAKTYRVQLSKAVPFAGTTLSPSGPVSLTGDALSGILAGEHKDSVYGAEEDTTGAISA